MIKKVIKIFFSIIFVILKKIFIRKNRVPNKKMDNFSNKLHSIFIFTSFLSLYLLYFDIKIDSFSINTLIYILLFVQIVIIIRYFNPQMLIVKQKQVKILKRINTFSLFIFIANWIFLSLLFSIAFVAILLLNNIFYTFIINQINKQKEKEEFEKQFGEGSYSKDDISKKHILNLFEENLNPKSLSKSSIKKQYRIMAKKYHPDVYTGDEKDKFASINLSYNFLLDFIN